jgi:hypothetical protein
VAIDWANEPYVRLYKRKTDDDLLLTWEARAVWHEMLKEFDRSGIIATRRGVRGLAAVIRVPVEVVERVMPELIEDGRIQSIPHVGFASKNYLVANDTPRSNRARQEESRTRRIQTVLSSTNSEITSNAVSHGVTPDNAESRDVTHIRSYQDRSDTDHQSATPPGDDLSRLKAKCDALNAPLELVPSEPKRRGRPKSVNAPIPEDWEPRQSERAKAVELGLDPDHEAAEFKAFWLGDGRAKKDWHMTFLNRLYTQSKRGGRWPQSASASAPIRKVKTL